MYQSMGSTCVTHELLMWSPTGCLCLQSTRCISDIHTPHCVYICTQSRKCVSYVLYQYIHPPVSFFAMK